MVESTVIQEAGVGPYKFLDYFVEKDEFIFGGRERDLREIVARLMVDRTVILYGPSGLGKTSLILAGVFPELRRRDVTPVYCRVLQRPCADVQQALWEELEVSDRAGMEEKLRERKIVLVVDQFEEFFVRFDKEEDERRELVEFLATLLRDPKSNLRILISLREDYLARLDELTEQIPGAFGSKYRLGRLTAFGARQAITRPLTRQGVDYEPKLVNHILEIASAEDFDSLLLQIICSAVAAEAEQQGRPKSLTDKDLEAVGGLDGVLQRYLDSATRRIPSELQLLTRTLLDALITSENTKRAVTFDSLREWDTDATPQELERALHFLRANRLVREESRGTKVWFELTHERLVKPILRWFERDRTFSEYRFARELIVNGARNEMYHTRPETLPPKETLERVIKPFRERLRLDAVQAEFLYWTAAYRMSDEVEFWSQKLPPEKCQTILFDLLGRAGDPVARAGAVRAATFVPDDDGKLAQRCVDVALHDAEESVRRAAGRALEKIGRQQEIERLQASLKRGRTKSAALEILADFGLRSPRLKSFGRYTQWRVKQIARKRIREQQRGVTSHAMKVGATVGVLAGLVWTGAYGLLLFCVLEWNSNKPAYLPFFSLSSGDASAFFWGMVAIVVISAAIGPFIGRSIGKSELYRQAFPWFQVWLVVAVLAFLIGGLAAIRDDDWRGPIPWIAGALAIWAVAVLHLRFVCSGIGAASGPLRRTVLGLFHGAAPLIIGGTSGLILSNLREDSDALFISMAIAISWSAFVFVMAVTIVESAGRTFHGSYQVLGFWSPRASKVSAVFSIIALPVWYFAVFGASSIPYFAAKARVSASEIRLHAYTHTLRVAPITQYFTVELPAGGSHLFRPDKTGKLTVGFGAWLTEPLYYFPPGKTLGVVASPGANPWTGTPFDVTFVPAAKNPGVCEAGPELQHILVMLRRDRSQGDPVWAGDLSCSRPDGADADIVFNTMVVGSAYPAVLTVPTGDLVVGGEERTRGAALVTGAAPAAFDAAADWAIKAQQGHVDLKMRLTYSSQDAKVGVVSSLRTPQIRAMDEANKLPDNVWIVLGFRIEP